MLQRSREDQLSEIEVSGGWTVKSGKHQLRLLLHILMRPTFKSLLGLSHMGQMLPTNGFSGSSDSNKRTGMKRFSVPNLIVCTFGKTCSLHLFYDGTWRSLNVSTCINSSQVYCFSFFPLRSAGLLWK